MVKIDYLIIGQGISGSFLSWNLIRAGKRVLVIDEYQPFAASRVASGIINPVTGRRIVRTWMIDKLMPFAQQAYEDFGEDLGVKVADNIDMLTFHTTQQMINAWYERIEEGEDYLQHVRDTKEYEKFFEIAHGIGITAPCMLVSLQKLLPAWREKLIDSDSLIASPFDIKDCAVTNSGIVYKNIHAEKLILCNGVSGFDNEYFNRLPYALSKGEAITVYIPGLPETVIYKQGMNLVPLGDGLFWIGSSFEWEFEHDQPTAIFRARVEELLNNWLKIPYEMKEHKASIRPASLERRPFVGLHPVYPSIGILNGMGTKGCSLAPYFSHEFAQNLLFHSSITPSADINRFRNVLIK